MSAEMITPSTATSEKIVERFGDIVVASLEATAQVSLGQGLLRFVDRVLWVVEKSAQWSLPIHEVNTEENGKTFGKIELVRPLPWIFFLPSLVMIRACRFGINVGAVILGYPKLQTTGMVKFIQKGRRRLRAIKSNGLKNMRYRKGSRNKDEELSEAKKSLIKSMLSTLSALSCLETSRRTPSPPPTRVYVQHREPETTSTPEEQSTTESNSPQVDPKRKYSEIIGLDDSSGESEEEESTEAKLERLAVEDSEADDRDFDPTEEELMNFKNASSSDEDDDYISDTEIKELNGTCSSFLTTGARPVLGAGIIVEEPEPEQENEVEAKVKEPENANKVSTPKKTTEEEKSVDHKLQPGKETEDEPVTPGKEGENTGNFYSPINSPADSTSDFKTPVANDAKIETILVEDNPKKTGSKKSVNEPETTQPQQQIDNGDLESRGTSTTISGNSSEGPITPSTNGTSPGEKRTNESKEKYHRKGKHTVNTSHRKEK